jgi:lysophospholipase L1-like esterase
MVSVQTDLIKTFVALGDSFTEGLEDDLDAAGRHQGWADRVARALAQLNGEVQYANLAVRGKLLRQVIADQVPIAERLAPDLISFHAGLNDLLRPRVDRAAVLHQYATAVARLRATGAQVLLFTAVARNGASGRTAEVLEARFVEFTDHVHEVARRESCLVADIGPVAALQDRRLWHEDRLHPGPAGHARVAAAVLEQLQVTDPSVLSGEPGWWQQPLLPPPHVGRLATARADLRWARRYLLPWVGRRLRGASSGDNLTPKHPHLIELRAQG